MKSIDFPEATTDLAKNQPHYIPMRVMMAPGPEGLVISCWKFSFWERLNLLFGGKLYLSLMMFRDLYDQINPVTPVMITPFKAGMFSSDVNGKPVPKNWMQRMHDWWEARKEKKIVSHDNGSRAEDSVGGIGGAI